MIINNYNLILKRNTWWIVLSCKTESCNNIQKQLCTHIKGADNLYSAKLYLENFISNNKHSFCETSYNNELFSFYVKKYIETRSSQLSPHVYYNYMHFCFPQVMQYFDTNHIHLQNVTKDVLNSFFLFLKNKNYAISTMKQISKIIRPTLYLCFEHNLISQNPYDFVDHFEKENPSYHFYNQLQLKKLLQLLSGHKLELEFKFLIFYGLRRSELLGLRWSSIDFTHNYFTINHKVIYVNNQFIVSDKLKTVKSERSLPLIKEIKQDLIVLKKQKELQKISSSYNHTFDDYIFTDSNGNLIKPQKLDYTLSSLLKRNNLPHIRLHDLRHSCASLLLSQGVQLKEIQEWLGHSSYSTTANIYSHLDLSAKTSTAKSLRHALVNNDNKMNTLFKKLNNCYDEIKKLGYSSLDDFYLYMQNQL